MLGITAGYQLSAHTAIPILAYVVSMLVMFMAMVYFHWQRASFAFMLATIMLCFLVGMLRFQMQHDRIVGAIPEGTRHVVGIVSSPPKMARHTLAVELRTCNDGKLMAYLQPKKTPNVGDTIELFTTFAARPTFDKDWNKTERQDDADSFLSAYRHGLYLKGISSTCYADSNSWHVRPCTTGMSPLIWLQRMQTAMVDKYRQAGMTNDEGAIIEAMTTGNRQGISHELRQQYARSGISHVLALSGFHLSFLYGLLEMFLLTAFIRGRWKAVSRLVAVVVIWMFVMLAGMSASLLRAAIMCSLMMLSNSITLRVSSNGRHTTMEFGSNLNEMGRHGLVNSLAMAAMIMLLVNPMQLFDIGFQLSFLSMLGIAIYGRRVMQLSFFPANTLKFSHKVVARLMMILRQIVSKVVETALISLVCSVITMPLVAYYFGMIPTLSILSNILVAPMSAGILLLSALWWLFSPVSMLQGFVGEALLSVATVMNDTARWVSSLDWSVVEWHPSVVVVCMAYALLCCLHFIVRPLFREDK